MAEVLLSKKRRHERRRRHIVRFVWGCILVAVIIACLSFISFTNALRVSTISITGNDIVPETDIQAVVDEMTSSRMLFIFSRKNIALFPTRAIEKKILSSIPRIETVSVRRVGFNSVNIIVGERKPSALWCRSTSADAPEFSAEHCYLLDYQGLIFADAPTYSGPVFIRFVEHTEDDSSPIWRNFLPVDRFQSLLSFVNDLGSVSVVKSKPSIVFMRSDGDIDIIFDDNLKLSLSGSRPLSDSRRAIELLLVNSDFVSLLKDASKHLEYLDARFEGKVFYKFSDVAK